MDGKIDPDQGPNRPIRFASTEKKDKKYKDQRPHAVAVNADDRPSETINAADIQTVVQFILHDQAENKQDDQQHDRFMFFSDIRIEQHGERESDQLKQQRELDQEIFKLHLRHPAILLIKLM